MLVSSAIRHLPARTPFLTTIKSVRLKGHSHGVRNTDELVSWFPSFQSLQLYGSLTESSRTHTVNACIRKWHKRTFGAEANRQLSEFMRLSCRAPPTHRIRPASCREYYTVIGLVRFCLLDVFAHRAADLEDDASVARVRFTCNEKLPFRLVKNRSDGIKVMAPPLPIPPYEMAMIWHERSHLDSAHSWLREQVTRVA
jgi:hypothetical protein